MHDLDMRGGLSWRDYVNAIICMLRSCPKGTYTSFLGLVSVPLFLKSILCFWPKLFSDQNLLHYKSYGAESICTLILHKRLISFFTLLHGLSVRRSMWWKTCKILWRKQQSILHWQNRLTILILIPSTKLA